jgi:tetratricopeptide (TPR) repeat protein
VKILKEAILLDPENSEVLTKIGEVLLRDDDQLDEAESFLKRALALNPEQTDAIVAYARIMEKRENNDKAMELYQKALKLSGNHVHTYFYLAVLNEKMEAYKNAITYFKKCISLDNGHYLSCMHLATLLVNAGETHRAEKYYKHALKIDPESLDAHFALGKLTHYTFEDPVTALEYYNFVVSKDPGHYKALCQLGILYCEQNDVKKAFQYLKD